MGRFDAYFLVISDNALCDYIFLFIYVDFSDAITLQANGTLIQVNEVEKQPGEIYEIRIKAPEGTRLELLMVDQSVYLSRNGDRLTKERVS